MAGLLSAFGGAMQGFGQGMVAEGERKRREQIERMKIQLTDERRAEDRQWAIENRDQARAWKLEDRAQDRAWDIEDRNYRAARSGADRASYRAPTPQEIQTYGLDPNRTYQVNNRTGQISSFGGERDAGGVTYRAPTPQEIETYGLDPNRTYQVNDRTGQISSFGSERDAGGTAAGLTAEEERLIAHVQRGIGDGFYSEDWPAPREELEPALRPDPSRSKPSQPKHGCGTECGAGLRGQRKRQAIS